MDDADLGELARDGDQWTLTFTRLAHPVEQVWQAVTEPEHLAAWFPQQIVGDRRAGGALRFVSPAGDGFDGEMLAFQPPTVLEFSWGGDPLRIELRPDGAGTVLTLTDTFGELGKAARTRPAGTSAWTGCAANSTGPRRPAGRDLAAGPPALHRTAGTGGRHDRPAARLPARLRSTHAATPELLGGQVGQDLLQAGQRPRDPGQRQRVRGGQRGLPLLLGLAVAAARWPPAIRSARGSSPNALAGSTPAP